MSVAERSCLRQAQATVLALLVSVTLLAAGCKKDQTVQVRPPSMQVSDTQGLSPAQQALIVEADTDYEIGPERPPLAIRDTAFPGSSTEGDSAPQMTIATMTFKAGHTKPSHRLIARIKSDGDYPAMGIHAGVNFLWRNSWDTAAKATWVSKVIPLKAGATEYALHRDARLHEYTTGDPQQPRLVRVTKASFAFAACLDDPMCGSGHCGYW